jgi:hypothetical protein
MANASTTRSRKSIKAAHDMQLSSNFPPSFWENLGTIYLTPRALREHNRQNRPESTPAASSPDQHPGDLARFARHGGPDQSDLRGVRDVYLLDPCANRLFSIPSQ